MTKEYKRKLAGKLYKLIKEKGADADYTFKDFIMRAYQEGQYYVADMYYEEFQELRKWIHHAKYLARKLQE